MIVSLETSLEARLDEIARARSVSVDELVRQVLTDYLRQTEDDPIAWVQSTQEGLTQVWPIEDFGDWMPPDADD